MASLSRCKKTGAWRILFTHGLNAHGRPKRNTLRPGPMTRKAAETVKDHVEALVAAALSDSAPDNRTAAWLRTIGPTLRKKLVKFGLAAPAAGDPGEPVKPVKPAVPTVAAFVDGYLKNREGTIKPRTMNASQQDRDSLVKFLGPDRTLDSITRGDARDFMTWLRREGYAEPTIGRRVRRCAEFFTNAVDHEIIAKNPFVKVKAPSQQNESRFYFVSRAETERLLEACPNAQWRLIVALSRYGGLRCPSETFALTWGDIDWERNRIRVPSPKTEHHEGKAWREIPLFPELLAPLQEAFDAAEPGTVHVVSRYRDGSANLRTQFLRFIRRAGLTPWPRVFHNMRASRQNELAAAYPIHVVCRWIGNSALIANKHYLSGTDDYFEAAIKSDAKSDADRSGTEQQERTGLDATHVASDELSAVVRCSPLEAFPAEMPGIPDWDTPGPGLRPGFF